MQNHQEPTIEQTAENQIEQTFSERLAEVLQSAPDSFELPEGFICRFGKIIRAGKGEAKTIAAKINKTLNEAPVGTIITLPYHPTLCSYISTYNSKQAKKAQSKPAKHRSVMLVRLDTDQKRKGIVQVSYQLLSTACMVEVSPKKSKETPKR